MIWINVYRAEAGREKMIVVPKDPCPCWNIKLKLLIEFDSM